MANAEGVLKKIVLLGDSAVGKTSLIRRFVDDRFDDEYISTIGTKVSKMVVPLTHRGREYEVKIMVWDIIGSQGFETSQSRHIAGVNGAILVGDLDNPKTIESLETYWIPLLERVTGGVLPPVIFAGNKVDLVDDFDATSRYMERFTDLEEKYCKGMECYLDKENKGWIFTSAKTGEMVKEAFGSLALAMLTMHPHFDPLYRQMEEIVAETIYEGTERNTPRAILDLIVTDMPQVLKSADLASAILQNCLGNLGVNKDDPSIDDLNAVVDNLTTLVRKQGVKEEIVEEYRNKWYGLLDTLEQ